MKVRPNNSQAAHEVIENHPNSAYYVLDVDLPGLRGTERIALLKSDCEVINEPTIPTWRDVTAECELFEGELVHISAANNEVRRLARYPNIYRVRQVERGGIVEGHHTQLCKGFMCFIVEKKEG